MAAFLNWLPLLLRRRRRQRLLAVAAGWPLVEAKLLKSRVVTKDALLEAGTAFQDSQLEAEFYFILAGRSEGNYFGGHLRSTALSDSEGHRLLRTLPDDLPVQVRYNPGNPDQTCVFADDNPELPFTVWTA